MKHSRVAWKKRGREATTVAVLVYLIILVSSAVETKLTMKCLERSKSIRFLGSRLSLATRNLLSSLFCIINSVSVCVYVFAAYTHTSAAAAAAAKCEYLSALQRLVYVTANWNRWNFAVGCDNDRQPITHYRRTWIDRLPQLSFFSLLLSLWCVRSICVDLGEKRNGSLIHIPFFFSFFTPVKRSRDFRSAHLFKAQHARREFFSKSTRGIYNTSKR